MLFRAALAQSHLGGRRHSRALLGCARRRRAVLQRERGPDGGRVRHSLRGRRADFSHRCGGGEKSRRVGGAAVGAQKGGRGPYRNRGRVEKGRGWEKWKNRGGPVE